MPQPIPTRLQQQQRRALEQRKRQHQQLAQQKAARVDAGGAYREMPPRQEQEVAPLAPVVSFYDQ